MGRQGIHWFVTVSGGLWLADGNVSPQLVTVNGQLVGSWSKLLIFAC